MQINANDLLALQEGDVITFPFSDGDINSVRCCKWVPFLYLGTLPVCSWTQKDSVMLTCEDVDSRCSSLAGGQCVWWREEGWPIPTRKPVKIDSPRLNRDPGQKALCRDQGLSMIRNRGWEWNNHGKCGQTCQEFVT